MSEELPKPVDGAKEVKPPSITDKEGDIRFKFKVGQLIQMKGFKVPYLVVNRYAYKNFPLYDTINYDKTGDVRTYQEIREDTIEAREPFSFKRLFNKFLM